MNYIDRIKKQEKNDYDIVCRIYSAICEDCTVMNEQNPMFSHIDMRTSAITEEKVIVWDTEIKNIQKDYKYFIIKVDKLISMLQESKGFLYICFLQGDFAYIYDVRKLDIYKLTKRLVQANKCEYDPSQGQDEQLHIVLPKSFAYKVIDICQL